MRFKAICLMFSVVLGLAMPQRANADFTFGEPVKIESAIAYITGYDTIDCLSYDGLEMYIWSQRSGGQGGIDIWVLKRASKDENWGPPENLGPAVNSPQDDYWSSISADGLTLYFGSSNRPGGYGRGDIWMTKRPTKNDAWGQAVNLGPTVNNSFGDNQPWISPDGLELYFKSDRSGGFGNDIWVTRRATVNDPWGTPVNLGPVVNSPYTEMYPCLSADGLMLFFSDDFDFTPRPGGYGASDMWMTRRASLSAPWQAPVNLGPIVNGPAEDYQPRISPDGRTLYFFSSGSAWQAPIIPIVDFNGDIIVNMKDFSRLAQYWRQNEPSVDIGPMPWGDGVVDMQDLAVLSEYWLKEIGLIAHWKLDETEGFVAHDSTGAHDCFVMAVNPLWQPTGGKIDGALELDGIDDYVSAPFVLNPTQGSFSVFLWLKGGGPGQVIISQQNGVNWLAVIPIPGSAWLMTDLKAPTGAFLFSQKVVIDGNWHRVGLTWDGSKRKLYVDDVEVAKDKDTQSSLTGSQGGLYFGAGKNLEPGSFWFGLIDDIRIYDRAVTP